MDEQQEADLIAGSMPCVTVYSDGGSRNNLGGTYGGYGAIAVCGNWHQFYYGGYPDATNNAMELTAFLSVLRSLTVPCRVHVISDSKYLVEGLNWVVNWEHNGWRTSTGKPVQNQELWKEIRAYQNYHLITSNWVKGHGTDRNNTTCDHLATIGMYKTANQRVPAHLIAPGRA